MLMLKIKVDTNDADYVEGEVLLTPELDKVVRKIAGVLRDGDWGNFQFIDFDRDEIHSMYHDLTVDEVETFLEACPNTENGFHSIESIKVRLVTEIENIFGG